ncbi:MAG: aspartate carbamoyltransferase [Acidobacteriaceae bacterium]
MQKLRHVVSTKQFVDTGLLERLFAAAEQMERDDKLRSVPALLRGRILATLFYEPSTRTRFSFESAMQKLGGGVLTAENARESSSATKGESIADTIRIVSGYADAIAMRHYDEGAAKLASSFSPVPIINAGDGIGEHPTQALGDIFTIVRELGGVEGINVVLIGDLLNGRTIHSLLPLLSLYKGVKITLVSPPQLRLPAKYKRFLGEKGVSYTETVELRASLRSADVVYVTRIQKERFISEDEYSKVKDAYVIDAEIAGRLKPKAIIMHALPRVGEISPAVDANYRAAYFRQAKNALYVRMALLAHLLG